MHPLRKYIWIGGLFALGALFLLPESHAQSAASQVPPGFSMLRYTTADGLPTNLVTDVAQTPDHYIWVASEDGLMRFDGIRFKEFNITNVPTMQNNRVENLWVGPYGALWFHTADGVLHRYQNGKFTRYDQENTFDGSGFRFLVVGKENLWITSTESLYLYDKGSMLHLGQLPGRGQVRYMREDVDGILWLGMSNGRVYTFTDGSFTNVLDQAEDLEAIYYDPATEDQWFGLGNRIIHRRGDVTRTAYRGNAPVGAITKDTEDQIWGMSGNTLLHCNPDPVQCRQVTLEPDAYIEQVTALVTVRKMRLGQRVNTLQLSDVFNVTQLIKDHEGSYWGAAEDGLYYMRPTPLTAYAVGAEGDQRVYPVVEDPVQDGRIWAGTFSGFYRLDGDRFVRRTRFSNTFFSSLYVDREQNLWGTYGGQVFRYTQGFFQRYRPPELRDAPVSSLKEDAEGTLWFIASDGLHGRKENTWTHIAYPEGFTVRGLASLRMVFFTQDGAIWIPNTAQGLYRIHPNTPASFILLGVDQGLSSNDIRHLFEDENGMYWVATGGGGLNRIDVSNVGTWDETAHERLQITTYRKADGLFDNVIHRIVPDDFGRFWISSNRGIFRVNKDNLEAFAAGEIEKITSIAYTERDGMRNREANSGNSSGFKARDGRIWFPTQDGVVMVDPARLLQNTTPPQARIEAVLVGSRSLPVRGTMDMGTDDRSFEIDYTALSFINPANMTFRYMLDGYDTNWIETTRRAAFYTKVPPGAYTFRVKGANNEGVWSTEETTLNIEIQPQFFETFWFKVLLALGVLGLGGAMMWYRMRSLHWQREHLRKTVEERTEALRQALSKTEDARQIIETQAEQLRELDQAKSRFFANISHEFRTPLTLMIGPLKDAADGHYGPVPETLQQQYQVMLSNGQRLLRLVNELLALAKLDAGAMELNRTETDLSQLVRAGVAAFASAAEQRKVTLSCEAVDGLTLNCDTDKIEHVVINLVSNALKFTPEDGSVRVRLEPEDQTVRLTVSDTGVGIQEEHLPHIFDRFYQVNESDPAGETSTGVGLALIKELVELHDGRVEVKSTVGVGTTFTVILPLDHQSLLHFGDLMTQEVAAAPMGDGATPKDAKVEPTPHPTGDDVTTVLIVEDHADMRSYMRSILDPHFRIVEAGNGEAGLASAQAALPDLIITDLMMPIMDGYALTQALKEDPLLAGVPVLMLTAKADVNDQVEGYASGADAYLTKPFDRTLLLSRVRNLIESRRQLKQHFTLMPEEGYLKPKRSPFERKLREFIVGHLTDTELSAEKLAFEMGLSYSQLARRLRNEVDTTATKLIRQVRVEHAAQLITKDAGNLTEIAYAVGFNSLSYFNRSFHEHFGTSPSKYHV